MTDGRWAHPFSASGRDSPLHLLVVQPTPFCNIDCRYCYLPHRHHTARMTLGTFRAILERLDEAGLYGSRLTILWHGGEPLTVPVAFYRDAYEVCRALIPEQCRFQFNFQTNATLITDEFCAFACEIGAHVGISIDGPQDLTDAARMFRNGNGAFAKIMAGVARLRANEVTYSAICVLRSDSLGQADRLFDFFAELGATDVGFNVEEIEGANRSSSLLEDETGEERFKSFMRVILRRWQQEAPELRFRDLAQLQRSMRHGTQVVSRLVSPFAIIAVGYDGSWSTFAPELLYDPRFRFGNVHHAAFEDALTATVFTAAFKNIRAGVEKCRGECDYFLLCGGGCPSNKIAETGSARSSETRYCRLTRKALADIVLEDLEQRYDLTQVC